MPKPKKNSKTTVTSRSLKRLSFLNQHFWFISAVCLSITFVSLLVIRDVQAKKRELWKMTNNSSKIVVPELEGEDEPVLIDLTKDTNKVSVEPVIEPSTKKKGWQKYTYTDAGFSIELPNDVNPTLDKELMNFTNSEEFYLNIYQNETKLIRISVYPENEKSRIRKDMYEVKNALGGAIGLVSEYCNEYECMTEYDVLINEKNYFVQLFPEEGYEKIQKEIISTFQFN